MFTVKNNIQKREKNLKNANKAVAEFKKRLSISVKKQEKLDVIKKQDFRRGGLLEKYIIRILYEQNNRKFKEYLKKLERNWQK